MITDIFSSFDPATYTTFINQINLWTLPLIFLFFCLINTWFTPTTFFYFSSLFKNIIRTQVKQTRIFHIKFSNNLVSALFISLIFLNFWGIIPYTFSLTTHLIFTLVLSLPLWASIIASSFVTSVKATIASFLPSGAPLWLNPFLILIELIRTIVRPVTLAFRISANISAGHVVLTLIRVYIASSLFSTRLFAIIILLSINIFYIIFEIGICIIQAFIFCLLLTLYGNDHQLKH